LICIANWTVVLGSFTRGIAYYTISAKPMDSMGCPGGYEFGVKPSWITWVAEFFKIIFSSGSLYELVDLKECLKRSDSIPLPLTYKPSSKFKPQAKSNFQNSHSAVFSNRHKNPHLQNEISQTEQSKQ
jgi:hypothetical protein